MTARATIEIGKYIENPKYGSYHIIGDGGFRNGKHMVVIRFDRQNIFPGLTTPNMENGHTIITILLTNMQNPNHNTIDPYQVYPYELFNYGCRGLCKDLTSDIHKRESQLWRNRINKIANPNDPNYPNYGGAGVTMCHRWRCFEFFSEDIKFVPGYDIWLTNPDYELDKDVKYGYIPQRERNREYSLENCMFIHHSINQAQAAYDANYYNPTKNEFIGVIKCGKNNYQVIFMGRSRGHYTNKIAAASLYNHYARYNNYPPHLLNKLEYEMSINEIHKYNVGNIWKVAGTNNYRMYNLLNR